MRKTSVLFLFLAVSLILLPPEYAEKPDLTVSNITSNLTAGEFGYINVNIENKSSVDLYTVTVRYGLKNKDTNAVHQDDTTIDCPANETKTVRIGVTLDYGDYLLTVLIDPKDTVEESNEENNKKEEDIHVSAPDLTVTDISFSNPAPKVDEEIQIMAEVKNVGEASTKEVCEIGFYDGKTLIDSLEVNKLAPGAFEMKSTFWTPTMEGEREIKVRVDLKEMVEEMDETNNTMTRSISAEKPMVYILSNAIDWHREGEGLEFFLESNKINVTRIFPNSFDSYRDKEILIMLGGHKAYDTVGYIVSQVLDLSLMNYLETEGAYDVFAREDVFSLNQKVIVLAGNDRELTARAILENKENILSYVKP
ncbi:MAG: CARDB domain-containing protein [Euryarchaeota archaeon]|nr:CARDB domain-containing protein [Euryarchaeota archaeon]